MVGGIRGSALLGREAEVGLQVGVVLRHKQLVIDVAEIIQRLVAAEAEGLILRLMLLTHAAHPRLSFLLIPHPLLLPLRLLLLFSPIASVAAAPHHLFEFKYIGRFSKD